MIHDGDLVSIDFGAVVEGWHGDAARSFVVGEARAEDLEMLEATRQAMWAGIAAVRDGGRVGDVSRAIEQCVKCQPRRYGLAPTCTWSRTFRISSGSAPTHVSA